MYSGRLGTVEDLAEGRWQRCRLAGGLVVGPRQPLCRNVPGRPANVPPDGAGDLCVPGRAGGGQPALDDAGFRAEALAPAARIRQDAGWAGRLAGQLGGW